jgi:hypothetical protein
LRSRSTNIVPAGLLCKLVWWAGILILALPVQRKRPKLNRHEGIRSTLPAPDAVWISAVPASPIKN